MRTGTEGKSTASGRRIGVGGSQQHEHALALAHQCVVDGDLGRGEAPSVVDRWIEPRDLAHEARKCRRILYDAGCDHRLCDREMVKRVADQPGRTVVGLEE